MAADGSLANSGRQTARTLADPKLRRCRCRGFQKSTPSASGPQAPLSELPLGPRPVQAGMRFCPRENLADILVK